MWRYDRTFCVFMLAGLLVLASPLALAAPLNASEIRLLQSSLQHKQGSANQARCDGGDRNPQNMRARAYCLTEWRYCSRHWRDMQAYDQCVQHLWAHVAREDWEPIGDGSFEYGRPKAKTTPAYSSSVPKTSKPYTSQPKSPPVLDHGGYLDIDDLSAADIEILPVQPPSSPPPSASSPVAPAPSDPCLVWQADPLNYEAYAACGERNLRDKNDREGWVR